MTPLHKRLPRDFRNNLGKYLGILFLMGFACAFVSGFLGSSFSIMDMCDTMREDYNVEDFYFTTMYEMDADDVTAVEGLGAKVYENFSRDVEFELVDDDYPNDISVRVFRNRGQEFDRASYTEGRAPSGMHEVALDRVFCANHGLEVGDTVRIAGEEYTLSGIMTLTDHTVTYKNSGDFMFNAVSFTVAQLSDEAFDHVVGDGATFTYSVLLDDRDMDDADRIDFEEDVIDLLVDRDVTVTNLVDREANIGLTFATSDVEGDSVMWEFFMVVLIVIMSFAFLVLTDATIEQESSVIGTLLASGYRKGEILRHYLILPAIIGITGVVVGNLVGINLLVLPMKDLYYNSYSFPAFVYHWHWEVFLLTSVVPFCMLMAITFLGLARKLGATPLQFLRHEVGGKVKGPGMKLPERLGYASRFRLRVFFRNLSHFATLFFGIMFGSILLLMGLVMIPMVDYNADLMSSNVPADHLYTLKAQLKLDGTEEERHAWAAAEELATNPAYDAVDLDLLEDIADLLDEMGVKMSDIAGEGDDEAITPPPYIEDAIEDSINHEVDASDPALHLMFAQVAGAAGIDLSDATDDQLTRLISLADAFHRQIHMLDDEHMELVGDLLEDIMSADSLDMDDPVNQTAIDADTLDQVERYAVASVEVQRSLHDSKESITVYGIEEGSQYWNDLDVADGAVLVGEGLMQKCGARVGEELELFDRFSNASYTVVPTGTCGNGTVTSIYMSLDDFRELFGEDDDYFNGLASDVALPLDARYVASELTPDVMSSMSTQIQDSMGTIMRMIVIMVVPIYLVLIYLLTKTVIDRSARSISYMKVFGYHDHEIDGLYIRAITVTVVASLILNIPIVMAVVSAIVPVFMSAYSGNFVVVYPPHLMAQIVGIGLVAYIAVAILHILRVRRVPLALALKVQE